MSHHRRSTRLRAGWLAALTLVVTSCSGEKGGSPSGPSGSGTDANAFRIAVLDGTNDPVTAADVMRVIARASDVLSQKTGARLVQTDFATVGANSPVAEASSYLASRSSAPPDGILAFSDDASATSAGGYSVSIDLPPPNQNRYPSPVVGAGKAYLAVVDFDHKYSRCGYDISGNSRVAATSANGECRGQSGLICVNNGRFWACPDTLNDLYADPDYYLACTVVHELLHPFGTEGNFDHYGTTQCTSRTGMSQADSRNLNLFQQSCGMCPDLYPRFKR